MKAIEKFRESEEYKYYKYGDDYYISRNTNIWERDIKCYMEGIGVTSNPFKANHKLAAGYLQKIVDQKVNYLLGNGIEFEQEDFTPDLGVEFDVFMNHVSTTASKKGRAWVYMYVDNGKLKATEVAPEQITPMYGETGELEQIIRQYTKQTLNKEILVTLVYDKDGVTEYEKVRNGWQVKAEYGHYKTDIMSFGKVVDTQEHSFGVVPFIELRNNPEIVSDLYPIKALIDIYDIINSDFANNIDDMQDAYFVIKNFAGDGYDDFLRQLKQTKAIKVGEDGDVTTNQLQIPVEARSTFLALTDKNIFKFAMAVDTTSLTGSSLTNVAIKAQFADLDLKVDKFETEVRKFIRSLIEFINAYQGASYATGIRLTRNMVINEVEMIQAVNQSVGTISQKTQLQAHPLVEDVEQELERLAEEGEGQLNSMGFNQ